MGGDSILAIKWSISVRKRDYHLGVVNLFSPTIEELADYIRNSQDQLASSVVLKGLPDLLACRSRPVTV